MKKCLILILIGFIFCTANAQQPAQPQPQTPQPQASPAGSVTSTVGLTDVKITYFRPQMKGRKIFGAGEGFLQPFGQLWRAGANTGTIISFSTDVKVEGKSVPKGEYLLFATPGKDEWTISFYKDISIGGNYDQYKAENELMHFTVKPQKLTETVETLTFNITDLAADSKSAKVQLAWENTSVKFGVVVP